MRQQADDASTKLIDNQWGTPGFYIMPASLLWGSKHIAWPSNITGMICWVIA